MNEEFQATYEHGVLRLDQPLALPDHSRVAGVVIALTTPSVPVTAGSDDDFNSELDELALNVPVLPADFTRADIYADHD